MPSTSSIKIDTTVLGKLRILAAERGTTQRYLVELALYEWAKAQPEARRLGLRSALRPTPA